jgi:hypothetical protein
MEKSSSGKHCCKDEYKLVKLTIDQKQGSVSFNLPAPECILPSTSWYNIESPALTQIPLKAYYAHAPPATKASMQSLLCVFRI